MSFGISLVNAKLDYALRAVVDLAMQSHNNASQSREIAARQKIPGPYLDQILAELKRAGIVRSVRGAGGGYLLNRSPALLSVGEVLRAFTGSDPADLDDINTDSFDPSATSVVTKFRVRLERSVAHLLETTYISDFVNEKLRYEDTQSFMPNL
ncbi:MAG: Rrf2 family transcriptional regulator [bacterium]|jgi:Rrf2 family cysteine metabolism transcriptional repressor